MRISVLTPVGPGRDGWLADTAGSVRACRAVAGACGVDLEWVVCLDGAPVPAGLPLEPDRLVRLATGRGVSTARNAALAAATGDWVLPLDADDLLDDSGFDEVVRQVQRVHQGTGWLGFNRLLVDGGRTPYWIGAERSYAVGALAQSWTSPFPFHPNSAVLRRELILSIGGWPAMLNEDIAALLLVGEEAAGAVHPAVLTRYRVWDGQLTAATAYHPDKVTAFATMEAMVNARRRRAGRLPVVPPDVSEPRDLRSAARSGDGRDGARHDGP